MYYNLRYQWKVHVKYTRCIKNLRGIFEHTCAYARWAHMHRFLSVRPMSLDQNPRLENNSFLKQHTGAGMFPSLDQQLLSIFAKSTCWCHRNSSIVPLDEVLPTTAGLTFQKSFKFWVGNLWVCYESCKSASLHFASTWLTMERRVNSLQK